MDIRRQYACAYLDYFSEYYGLFVCAAQPRKQKRPHPKARGPLF